MEKTKHASVYLEESQIRYLKLQAMLNNFNVSEYLRCLIDEDMETNNDICKEYEKVLYTDNFKTL
ncbi:hypothetical protein [Niallia sp. RD1]|uniref:hypothetical protein n=1 Tax=Niallia sp. RD1 TaxID=2962858 RepID=UPI0020C18FCF|nr:hypothetical protein [Niallia sp. RD1]UTI43735.1 hypothetical protein NKG37_08780 [Niallia sp. RD1]